MLGPEIMPSAGTVELQHDERIFPVPARVFVKSLIKTDDEIWSKLLLLDHGNEARTPDDWAQTLSALKQRKA